MSKVLKNVPIPFVGQSYKNRDIDISNQSTVNMFPEINGSKIALKSFPGVKVWKDLGVNSNIRGLSKQIGDRVFAVSGNTLYRLDSSGAETAYTGTISGDSDVILRTEGANIVVFSEGNEYAGGLDSNTVSEVTLPLGLTSTGDYLDSRIISSQPDGQFVVSAVDDATTIDALDSAEAESFPDELIRIIARNRFAIFCGPDSMEQWINTGSGRPPLDRTPNGVLTYGIAGRMAINLLYDTLYFLDPFRIPRRLLGFEVPQDLSDPARGAAFGDFSITSDCQVIPMVLDAQNFIIYSFPSENQMWCLHEKTGTWLQLKDDDDRFPINCYTRAFNKNLVGDFSDTGKIYELDFGTFDIDGRPLLRQRDTAIMDGEMFGAPGAEITFNRLELEVQTGVGGLSGDSRDPQVSLYASENRGRSFSQIGVEPLGQTNENHFRVEVEALGQFQNVMFRAECSDPVRFTIRGANADIELSDA